MFIIKVILALPFRIILLFTIVVLDICLFIFQQTSLRSYGIPFTKRNNYLFFENKKLSFLYKIDYFYSIYINGILKYAVEMIGRTEKYWCPIKHAKRKAGEHNWEKYFAEYGDEIGFKKTVCNLEDYKKLDNYKKEEKSFFSRNTKEIITFPIIWGMGFIVVLTDLSIFIYQQVVSRLYNNEILKRSDYVVLDRKTLKYLKLNQKFNCIYCGYVNGVFQYSEAVTRNNAKKYTKN